MIKSFSLVAMAALVMVGCNSGSKNSVADNTTKTLSSYSDAEKLAYAIAKQGNITESAGKSKKSKSTRSKSRAVQACDSGTMEFFLPQTDILSQITDASFPNKIVFHNCKQGDETFDGSIEFTEDGDTSTMGSSTGFTVTGGEYPGSMLAGGNISIRQDGEWEVSTINAIITVNGVKHGGENLVYRSKEFDDGTSIEYPVSGKEKIGESAYFTVDPAYDASATPFKTDANGDLISGLFKYVDDNQHSVELEITAKEVVTVRVDEDGNGSFVGDEVSTISL